jgi:hypothetical protein
VEVKNNPKIQKLQEQGVIALQEVSPQKEAPLSIQVEEVVMPPSTSGKKKQNPPSETVTNQP